MEFSMSKNNCFITQHDAFWCYLYDQEMAIEVYGPEWIEEEGVQVPEELLKEYKEVMKKFYKIQDQLEEYHRKQGT